ncbi:MAG TPA: APC family permease [Verrucomicrobiae bacterium]|nr:APC family permease [Verrucomicrobiae bacterium]
MSSQLARELRLRDYFSLAFGAMIGVGWLVLMDDWLARGGPFGAMLAFAIGGLLLLPIGYVYGEWVKRLPDAAGEAAYTAQVFSPIVSYFTGWIMLLAYFIVCPWEAVAIGKIAGYLIPSLNSFELYRVGGQPVFLPRLLLGILMTLFLAVLNYRGIRASANFQGVAATTVLALIFLVSIFGLRHGTIANMRPGFSAPPLLSILLVLQIVPYFMTGFESVPKVAEEAHKEFRSQGFYRAIVLALFVGTAFYVAVIAAVSFTAPWQSLLGQRFATAAAFREATGMQLPVRLILIAALFGLFQCFNGNFIAASRLLFSFARRGTVPARFAAIHPVFQTPSAAIVGITLATLTALFFGDALLVPVTEVGSMASACGWLAASLSLLLVESRLRVKFISALASVIALLLLGMKLIPKFPGHFSQAEWIALAIWLLIGVVMRWTRPSTDTTNA